jgi:hypothetical protein
VDPRAGLDDVEKRKFLTLPGLELRPLGRPAVASRYTDCAILAPAIHKTGRGCPSGCEPLGLQHFLDDLLIDGGEVISLIHRPPFAPQEDSWYSFLLEAESTLGL